MNLKLVFRIAAVIAVINGLGLLFMGATFFAMANITPTPDLITVGQFTGVTVLFLALLQWRIPDIAGDALIIFRTVVWNWICNVVFNNWVSYHDRTSRRSYCLC